MAKGLDPVRLLLTRLAQIAADLGLEMHQGLVMPNPDPDGPDLIQAVFIIRQEAVEEKVSPEQEEIDKQFEEMMRGEKASEADDARKKAAEDLKGWLDG